MPRSASGRSSPYNSDIIVIDGNTGTQLDVPPHSVTPPDSGCPTPGHSAGLTQTWSPPGSSAARRASSTAATCVDAAPPGRSPLIGKERVIAWEKAHRPLGPGDVVLFYSGYSDQYYKPMPEGRRFARRPARRQGARPGPAPIPTAWSTSPAARS